MRDIKFRAWDKHRGERGLMLVNHNFASISATGLANFEGLIWMQYTGLLDKNGKEIYESDLFADEDLDRFYVVWSDEHCGWGFSNGDPFTDFYINKMEVIGNIYENPELLNTPHME